MNHDILATIDAAIGCQQCGQPIGDSPSDDFCTPACQTAWSAARAEALNTYDEPDELPVHAHNLVELHSPETCVACSERQRRRQIIAEAFVAQFQAMADAQREAVTARATDAELRQRDPFSRTTFQVRDQHAERVAAAWSAVRPQRVYLGFDVASDPVGVTVDGEVIARNAAGQLRAVDHVVSSPGHNDSPILAAYVEQAARDRDNLAREAGFPADWVEQFAGVTLADWQVEALRAQAEAHEVRVREVAARLHPALVEAAKYIRGFIDGVRDAAAALKPFADALAQPKPPTDPRARALWLRQNRSTGPAASARAPRSINPRRSR